MAGKAVTVLQSDILESYYADNAKKLHRVTDGLHHGCPLRNKAGGK